jgi:hypothetical protein
MSTFATVTWRHIPQDRIFLFLYRSRMFLYASAIQLTTQSNSFRTYTQLHYSLGSTCDFPVLPTSQNYESIKLNLITLELAVLCLAFRESTLGLKPFALALWLLMIRARTLINSVTLSELSEGRSYTRGRKAGCLPLAKKRVSTGDTADPRCGGLRFDTQNQQLRKL